MDGTTIQWTDKVSYRASCPQLKKKKKKKEEKKRNKKKNKDVKNK